jgi:hypothetical protein
MLAPLVLEWVGVLPPTFSLEGGAIVIRSWVLELDSDGVYAVLIGGNLGLLATISSMVIKLRAAQDEAALQHLLVTWHLRQMVTPATSAAASAPPTAAR